MVDAYKILSQSLDDTSISTMVQNQMKTLLGKILFRRIVLVFFNLDENEVTILDFDDLSRNLNNF